MVDETPVPEVEPVEAQKGSREGGLILDVREADELTQASIEGALHIPLGELYLRTGDVPVDRDVFVICQVGQRSTMATDFLRQLGHESVWNVRGGIIAWYRSGLPVNLADRD